MRLHLEKVQEKLKWKSVIHVQPFVIAVGDSFANIVQSHIVLDKAIIYSFSSVPDAVDLCFQLYHAFHAEYPLECHNVWEFIQQAVHNIYTPFDWNHRATSELAEKLGLTLKQSSKLIKKNNI